MKSTPNIVQEVTHLLVRSLDGSVATIPVAIMSIIDDPKVLIHLREFDGELIFECSSKLFKNSESQLQSLTFINDGEQGPDSRSILVTCDDRAVMIPVTRITRLLKTPPEFKAGIIADVSDGLIGCSIAYSAAFDLDIEQIDSIQML